jgi:ketosteroid isomerase-like protein
MSEENVEIVRRGYELFAAGELEALSTLIAHDADTPDAGGLGLTETAGGVRRGPEGFLRAIEDVTEIFDDYRVEAEKFVDAGDAVVVSVRISGRGKASGMQQEEHLAHLWILRDGKAIHGEVHRTVEEALKAAGLEP